MKRVAGYNGFFWQFGSLLDVYSWDTHLDDTLFAWSTIGFSASIGGA